MPQSPTPAPQAQASDITVEIDGNEYQSPRETTPLALKRLVKPADQAGSFDLQEINAKNHVTHTYRAATQDNVELKLHPNQRFQLLSNGAPFS